MCMFRSTKAKQQASNWAALPEHAEVEWPKARARPNVEVNRRAEGTSELNRRLGAVEKGVAALERCGAAGDCGWGRGGRQAACGAEGSHSWMRAGQQP